MKNSFMKIAFDENVLIRSICREDYYSFIKEFWDVLPNDKFHDNWHIKKICDELQYMFLWFLKGFEPGHDPKYDFKPYDLVINQPPGSTKSLLCSVYFQAWAWTWYPQLIMIGSSYNENLSISLSQKTRQVVKSEKYQAVFPEIKISQEQDAKGNFANTRGGERISCGQSSVTGKHAHLIVVDDPLDPRGVSSDKERQEALTFYTDVLSKRKKIPTRTFTILVMQRLHQMDTCGLVLSLAEANKDNDNYRVKHICLPAILTEDLKPAAWAQYYRHADPAKNGLFDPTRFPKTFLDEQRIPGEYSFACQYLQRAVPLGGGMFKIDKLQHKRPDEAAVTKFVKVVRYWDKAATQGGGCFTVGTKMGKDVSQRYWILDVKRGQWDSARREATIRQTTEDDRVGVIVGLEQEPGSSGKDSTLMTVQNLSGFRIVTERPTGSKEERADPFSSQVNGGNVCIVDAPWTRAFIEELGLFPNSTGKDQVDSASGGFRMLATHAMRVGGWRSKR